MSASRRCYVHVGLPKTGTSYLQTILWRSREEVRRQGVTLLPTSKRDRRYLSEVLRDKLDPSMDPPAAYGVLDRLRSDASSVPGDRALISDEVLGGAAPKYVARLIDHLPDFEVHVVVTVRDLSRTIPSAWQQSIQGRGLQGFEDYVADFVQRPERFARTRRRHVLRKVLAGWETAVPRERVHVVTVPRPDAGPRLLLERFCSVVGLDTRSLDAGTAHANASLGIVQAELLRRVNIALGDRLPHRRAGYTVQGRDFLGRGVLLAQRGDPPRLPEELFGWFADAADDLIRHLAEGGYHVVGDLEELRPSRSAFRADQVVTESALLHSAVTAMADMLADRHEQSARLDGAQAALRDARLRLSELER